MKNKTYTLLALMLVVCAASCREDMPDMQNPNTQNISDWDDLFECYWNGMNYNYIFWDTDPTDWDEVYVNYKPMFESIADKGFDDPETNEQAVEWLTELSSTFIDHHMRVTIYSATDSDGNYYRIIPSKAEYTSREEYREDYVTPHKSAVVNKLYDEGRLDNNNIATINDDDGERHYFCGLLDNQIAYFSFYEFVLLSDLVDEPNSEKVRPVYDRYVDLLDNYEDLKGVIIDVRGNRGGYTYDLDYVIGKFVSEPVLFAYTRSKSGTGRLDYTPWTPEYVFPVESNRNFDNIPIVILADINSVSMAEMTTLGVLSLPAGNGVFIGERTRGATGPIDDETEHSFGGPFGNSAIYVYMSSTYFVDPDKVCHEGYGFDPTIECRLDTDLITQGIDNQLERAVTYIKTGE